MPLHDNENYDLHDRGDLEVVLSVSLHSYKDIARVARDVPVVSQGEAVLDPLDLAPPVLHLAWQDGLPTLRHVQTLRGSHSEPLHLQIGQSDCNSVETRPRAKISVDATAEINT